MTAPILELGTTLYRVSTAYTPPNRLCITIEGIEWHRYINDTVGTHVIDAYKVTGRILKTVDGVVLIDDEFGLFSDYDLMNMYVISNDNDKLEIYESDIFGTDAFRTFGIFLTEEEALSFKDSLDK